jgi:HSP20 family protein
VLRRGTCPTDIAREPALQEVTMARSYFPASYGESIGSLFREVEKTFEDFARRTPFGGSSAKLAPHIDVSESSDALDVIAELPGVDEKDIDVTLDDGVLTIRGEKKSERVEEDKNKNWHVVERRFGSFARTIPLPFDPDAKKITATFNNGVLRIRLPKSPEQKTKKERKIEIRTA